MHMLLGTTGLDPDAPHVEEAARIYSDLLERQDLSTEHREELKENRAIAEYTVEYVHKLKTGLDIEEKALTSMAQREEKQW